MAGDAILAEFASVVACVGAAVDLQTELQARNRDLPADRRIQVRIGVNLGGVIEDRGEIYGDGVNVAARLEALAPPGSICISGQVAEQIAGKLPQSFLHCGPHRLKNIDRPVEVWCWPATAAQQLLRAQRSAPRTRLAAGVGWGEFRLDHARPGMV